MNLSIPPVRRLLRRPAESPRPAQPLCFQPAGPSRELELLARSLR